MSPLPLKINLPMQSLKNHLRVFSEASGVSPDEWAATETSLVKIGDVFTMFKPAKVYAEGDDLSELEVAGVALVFREDAGFPMNYLVEGSTYEMSFMEGVLSSKATEAKDQGLAFYCFHSTLSKPLTTESGTALGGMHKWGGSGDRSKAPQGLPDPLYFFLTSLGIAVDPITSKEPLPVNEFVLSLWNQAELPVQSKAPKVAEFFTPLEGTGLSGGSAPAVTAAPQVAAAPAPTQAPPQAKPVAENKPNNEYAALSLSALLDDWTTPAKQEDAGETSTPGNGTHTTAPAPAAASAQPEDGKLSELLGKMASISSPANDASAKPATAPASNNPFAKALSSDAASSTTPPATPASNNPFASVLPSASASAETPPQASAADAVAEAPEETKPAKSGDATSGLFGDDDDDSLELAKLENALKDLVSTTQVTSSAVKAEDIKPAAAPEAKPTGPIGRRGALGPQFDDSDGAWEMLKAKPKPSEEPPPAPAKPASGGPVPLKLDQGLSLDVEGGLDFSAALAAELNSEVTLALPGAEPPAPAAPKTMGMEPWPADFAAALAAELNSEVTLDLPGAEPPPAPAAKTMGMEPWPSDFAAALKEGLEEAPPAPPAAAQAKTMGMEPWPSDFAAALKEGLDGPDSAPMDLASVLSAELNAEVSMPLAKEVPPPAPLVQPPSTVDAIADLLTASKPSSPPPVKAESAASINPFQRPLTKEPPVAPAETPPAAAEPPPVAAETASPAVAPPAAEAAATADDATPTVSKAGEKDAAQDTSKLEALMAKQKLGTTSSKLVVPSVPLRGQAAKPDSSKLSFGKISLTGKTPPPPPAAKPSEPAAALDDDAELKAKAEAKAKLEADARAMEAELLALTTDGETAVAEPEAKVEEVAEAVVAEPEAKVEEVVEAVVAEPEAKVEEVAEAVVAEPEAKVEEVAEAVVAEPEAKVEEVAEAVVEEPEAKVEEVVEAVVAEPEAKVEEVAETVVAEPEAKVEEVAEAVVAELEAKAEEVAEAVVAEPEAKVEEVTEAVVAEPEAKVEEVAETVVAEPEAKTEDVAETVVAEPEAKVEEVAEAVVAEPEAKVEEVAETVVAESEAKTEDVAEAVVAEPEAKVEEVAEAVVAEPEAKVEEVAEAVVAEPEAKTEEVTEAAVAEPEAAPEEKQTAAKPAGKDKASKSAAQAAKVASSLDDDDDEDSSRPQKKLSLQATLAKLEEQSARANVRLAEFKKAHELSCNQDKAGVQQQIETYEKSVNEALSQVRETVISKLQQISAESKENLQKLVGDGQKQIEERLPHALADLQQIASEADSAAVLADLQGAASKFQEQCRERLGNMESEQQRQLAAAVDEEMGRLEGWKNGQLKSFIELFEQILARVEQQRISSLSALESCVHSLSEELRRLQDFDLQRLALLNSELSKNLEQACKLAEMRLTRHCDMALAEQILPLLAEWKGSLALKSRKHRLDIQEYLEGHSESSLANFEPVLSLGKEAVTLIVSNVGELKEKIEDVEKAQFEQNLAKLSKHFDKSLEELAEHFKELQSKESSGAATQESDSIQKVDKAGEASLKKLEDSCNSTEAELSKQSENYVASWESRSETICSAAMTEMTSDVESVKNHRRESLRKLQEKLNKLTSNVQALQAQLIQ